MSRPSLLYKMSRLKDVELNVARLLEAAGLGSLANGAPPFFPGPFPEGAVDAFMACRLATGGEAPGKYLANAGTSLHRVVVTVLVRDARGPGGYLAGFARARAAWEAMYDTYPEGYVHMVAQDGGPTYIGEDEDGRPRWTFTVEAVYASDRRSE